MSEESEDQLPIKNDYLNKLTMEMFLNKNHYAKYLQKTDPVKHDEYRAFKKKLNKYAVDIIDITSQMIEAPKQALSVDIEETFDSYVKALLRHFEMKEMELPSVNENERDDEDSETLFGNMDQYTEAKSFWGKEKVVKKSHMNNDIKAFANAKF